jgi:hypothetical protein
LVAEEAAAAEAGAGAGGPLMKQEEEEEEEEEEQRTLHRNRVKLLLPLFLPITRKKAFKMKVLVLVPTKPSSHFSSSTVSIRILFHLLY